MNELKIEISEDEEIINAGVIIKNKNYIICGLQQCHASPSAKSRKLCLNGFGGMRKPNNYVFNYRMIEKDETDEQINETKRLLIEKNKLNKNDELEKIEETALREFFEELFSFRKSKLMRMNIIEDILLEKDKFEVLYMKNYFTFIFNFEDINQILRFMRMKADEKAIKSRHYDELPTSINELITNRKFASGQEIFNLCILPIDVVFYELLNKCVSVPKFEFNYSFGISYNVIFIEDKLPKSENNDLYNFDEENSMSPMMLYSRDSYSKKKYHSKIDLAIKNMLHKFFGIEKTYYESINIMRKDIIDYYEIEKVGWRKMFKYYLVYKSSKLFELIKYFRENRIKSVYYDFETSCPENLVEMITKRIENNDENESLFLIPKEVIIKGRKINLKLNYKLEEDLRLFKNSIV